MICFGNEDLYHYYLFQDLGLSLSLSLFIALTTAANTLKSSLQYEQALSPSKQVKEKSASSPIVLVRKDRLTLQTPRNAASNPKKPP